MSREKRKLFVIASALTLGLGVLTPFSAMAETKSGSSIAVQAEQQIKGTVLDFWRDGMTIKTEDGKRYHIGLHLFSEEQFEAMGLTEGAVVQATGKTLESFNDFHTFEVYKRDLPNGVTAEELIKLEALFTEMKALEKAEKWEETMPLYEQMDKILRPYYLAQWEPESFEEHISWYEYSFTAEDLETMKKLYGEWVSLAKSGQEVEAQKKMDEFYGIINGYYVPPTFEEMFSGMEIKVSDEDYAKLKVLYEEAMAADRAEDYELSAEKWAQYEKIMRPYYREAYPPLTFEEHMSHYDFEVAPEDLEKLENLYANIMEVENSEHYEQVYDLWDAFYVILEPYYKLNESLPFLPEQVIVNGTTFSK